MEFTSKYPFKYIVKYIPKRYGRLEDWQEKNRQAVYDFKKGICKEEYKKLFIDFVQSIVGNKPQDWVIIFIPASSQDETEKRYKELAKCITENTSVDTNIHAICNCVDCNVPKHLSDDGTMRAYRYDVKYLRNKNVIIIDDVITTASTFKHVSKIIQSFEVKKIWGIVFALTIHPGEEKRIVDKANEALKDTVILTKEMIELGGTKGVGFTDRQVSIFNVPKIKGWKSRLIGTRIYKKDYKTFLELSNNKYTIEEIEKFTNSFLN